MVRVMTAGQQGPDLRVQFFMARQFEGFYAVSFRLDQFMFAAVAVQFYGTYPVIGTLKLFRHYY